MSGKGEQYVIAMDHQDCALDAGRLSGQPDYEGRYPERLAGQRYSGLDRRPDREFRLPPRWARYQGNRMGNHRFRHRILSCHLGRAEVQSGPVV